MHRASNILSLTFLLLCSLSEGCQLSIEAEQGTTDGTTTHRGGTSNKLTVRLNEDQYIIWGFVTESSCMLQVLNVEYTNDGLSDTITLYVDGQLVGSFDTRAQSNNGHLWNEPVTSGPIGDEIMLSTGNHTIKLVTRMDEYGIEVDRIILALTCTDRKCPKFQVPDLISNADSWSRGEVIAVAIGVPSFFLTLIGIIIAIIKCLSEN